MNNSTRIPLAAPHDPAAMPNGKLSAEASPGDAAEQASRVIMAAFVTVFVSLIALSVVSGAGQAFGFSTTAAQVAFGVVAAVAVLITGVASTIGSGVLSRFR